VKLPVIMGEIIGFGPLADIGVPFYGYGQATKGTYDVTKKGWKTFGSVGQGPTLQGVKEEGKGDCENRKIFLTIQALDDMKDTFALLEMASWGFNEPSRGGVVRG